MLTPYRILDFTDERGELAGMILGDLGADVIRVEPPEGSAARRSGPVIDAGARAGDSVQFIAYNRNKRSVVLALSESRDQDALVTLVKSAHVVFESFPDGELERHGIDFDTLSEWNPNIVLVRISAFGDDGPHAFHAASDLTIAAMSGSVSLQGHAPTGLRYGCRRRKAGVMPGPGERPARWLRWPRSLAAAVPSMSMYRLRRPMTWTMMDQVGSAAHALPRRERTGSLVADFAGVLHQTVFPCRDGFVTFSPGTSEMKALVDWLVEEELLDASFLEKSWAASWEIPREGQERFPSALQLEKGAALLARYDREQLMEAYIKRGVRTAPLFGPRELLGFHHLTERGYWMSQPLGEAHQARGPGQFVHLQPF